MAAPKPYEPSVKPSDCVVYTPYSMSYRMRSACLEPVQKEWAFDALIVIHRVHYENTGNINKIDHVIIGPSKSYTVPSGYIITNTYKYISAAHWAR